MDIDTLIQRIVLSLPGMQRTIVTGKVTAVDASNWTCTVEVSESYTRNDVRIRAIEDGTVKGFILKPKVGSEVTIKMGEQNRNLWFLDMVSEVDEVYLLSDANGGVLIAENVKDKLNRLENKVNDLITKFNNHIHITTATVGTGPVGTIAPTVTTETAITPLTTTANLESTTVKHG